MTPIQKLAVAYAFLFFGVVAVGYGFAVYVGFRLARRVHDHFATA